jgi:hypothetical protein
LVFFPLGRWAVDLAKINTTIAIRWLVVVS